MTQRPVALFAMRSRDLPDVFPPHVLRQLREAVTIDPDLIAERFDDPRVLGVLASAEILITGWASPVIDAKVLAAAPRLRSVVHWAGSVKGHLSDDCWDRGLQISSAAEANGVPVAEYSLAAILFAGKGLFALRERYRADRAFTLAAVEPGVGNFRRRVGIIGASRIGRRVIELLRPFDFEVFLADPYVEASEAAALGVTPVDLDTLLACCDVVSVHAPATPGTRNMLNRDRLALMREGATLINTARGELVDTEALTDEVARGRLSAVLDVTHPEPLDPESRLFDLPGAFLTPHVAGSHGNELERLGRSAVGEVERLVSGLPLAYPVLREQLSRSA
ncbi:hydroxyacid dehydrogenase [Streptomyces sp. NPDC051320]|uniref:hydroxyacid dehydrogenase n=1 Tax=Streptomyces sp. NPDC051320 TaxID=3154644 RepID=UPI003420FE82